MTGFGAHAGSMTNLTMPSTHTTHPSLADDDPRAVFARAVAVGATVISAVRPDQLSAPTPCRRFDVRALLGHLVGVLRRVAVFGRAEDPFSVPNVVEATDGSWSDAWQAAADEMRAAWADDQALTRVVRLPWAEMPGGRTLAVYTSEITTHTWDLAAATGQRPAWDDEVVAVALAAMQEVLPAENRMEIFRAVAERMPPELRDFEPPFGEAVTVTADAPLIDQLVAWTGRRP